MAWAFHEELIFRSTYLLPKLLVIVTGRCKFSPLQGVSEANLCSEKIISLWKAHAMAKLPVDRQLDRNGIRQNRVLQG